MRGAGGTPGGGGQFFLGLAMMIGGFYLLLQSISVRSGFHLGTSLYRSSSGGFAITSGMVLIPFLLGVGIVFYNSKNALGWLLAGGSLVALIFGVLASVQFRMQGMTAFELITILVLSLGGVGLFLRSLRTLE
jgi:hypothetical protein